MSVIRQDYPHLEYLVLDDGSSDGTLSVIKKYAKNLRYESHQNMGETRTVNKGFTMVRGEIVAIVNSDDPLLPGAVSAAVELMSQRPDILVAYPDWYIIDARGRRIGRKIAPEYDYVRMVSRHDCIPGPGAFFRKSLIEQIGGRDEQFRYVADFDFWLRAGLIGPFARIPEPLATFRWHGGGASNTAKGALMAEEHLRLMDKVFSMPGLTKEIAVVRTEAYSNAYYEAAMVCGDLNLDMKREYFLRALRMAPRSYLLEYTHKLAEPIVLIFLGKSAYTWIKKIYRSINKRRQEKYARRLEK